MIPWRQSRRWTFIALEPGPGFSLEWVGPITRLQYTFGLSPHHNASCSPISSTMYNPKLQGLAPPSYMKLYPRGFVISELMRWHFGLDMASSLAKVSFQPLHTCDSNLSFIQTISLSYGREEGFSLPQANYTNLIICINRHSQIWQRDIWWHSEEMVADREQTTQQDTLPLSLATSASQTSARSFDSQCFSFFFI